MALVRRAQAAISTYSGYLLIGLYACVLHCRPLPGQVFEGRVLEDHSGSPLVSVQVSLQKVGTTGLAVEVETGSDGRFRTPNLPEGEYWMEVSRPVYARATLRLSLPSAPMVVRLVRFGAISGRVTELEGRPAHGATVFVLVQSIEGHLRRMARVAAAQTDTEGRYRLYNLPPGRYAVAVSWSGGAPGAPSGAYVYPSNARPELFTISGGEEYRGVDFGAPLGARYSISGSLQPPAPGARFSVTLVSADQPALAVAITQAGSDGRFRLEGIPSGSYELLAAQPAAGFGGMGLAHGTEPLFGRVRVEVAGQAVEGLSVPLEKGRTIRFVLDRGTTRAEKSCPSSGMLVLSPLENWGAILYREAGVTSAKEQVVEGLAPGRYDLRVTKLGAACFGAKNPVLDTRIANDSTPIPVLVTAAGSVRGRLKGDSAQVQNSVVVLLAADWIGEEQPVRVALPNRESSFSFPGLSPGRYRIHAARVAETSTDRWFPDIRRMVEIEVGAGSTDVELPVQLTGEHP